MGDVPVRVGILEDHQSIIDGYKYRLSMSSDIKIVWTASYGEQLEPLLSSQPVDVLLADVNVPVSEKNHNPFPILHVIPVLLKQHPSLHILAITMLKQDTLVEALVNAGVSGYILKDDQASIQQLANIVIKISKDGVYFSKSAQIKMLDQAPFPAVSPLTLRQLEILSICAAYPDISTAELARELGIASSTLRNLLSGAYLRLDVRTRAAAIAKAQQLGLLVGTDFVISQTKQ